MHSTIAALLAVSASRDAYSSSPACSSLLASVSSLYSISASDVSTSVLAYMFGSLGYLVSTDTSPSALEPATPAAYTSSSSKLHSAVAFALAASLACRSATHSTIASLLALSSACRSVTSSPAWDSRLSSVASLRAVSAAHLANSVAAPIQQSFGYFVAAFPATLSLEPATHSALVASYS